MSGYLHTGRTHGRIGYGEAFPIDEVRRAREEEAIKYRFDIKDNFAAAKRRQRHSGHKVVSFVSKKKLSA